MNNEIREQMKKYKLFLVFFFIVNQILAQSLFENSINQENEKKKTFQFNGYARSDVFANEDKLRSVFGELSLQLETSKYSYGKAFVDMRIKQDLLIKDETKLELREGYVDLFFDKIDFRIGQQIVVWGRADGFNPTNNITPYNFGVFSPLEDDRRMSNFVFSGTYNAYPWRFNFNWVPVYKPSELPFLRASNNQVQWGDNIFPDFSLSRGTYAFKLMFEAASVDGSLSYFNGFYKLPGIDANIQDPSNPVVFQKAHTTQIFGADFSTQLNNWGLRGEFAYTIPEEKTQDRQYIPLEQLEYTVGLDKEWDNFSLITQYIGKYIPSFGEKEPLSTNVFQQLLYKNNSMLFKQTEEWSHATSIRPMFKAMHETLIIELLSLYYFKTEELYIKPNIGYALSDNISLSLGGQMYFGPKESLFDILEHQMNALFVECKVFF